MSEQKSIEYVVTSINQGEAVQWRHDTMPDGVWRRGVAELWDPERDCWYVRDAAGFLLNVANFYKNIMPSKDGLPITADDEVVALREDLKSAAEARDMATALLHKRKTELDQMHAALLRAEKGHADVQEELEKVRDELVTAQAARVALEAKDAEHKDARSSLRQEVQDFLRGMNEETERANKIAEELDWLRVDHAALYENYTEFKTAYQKAHDECSSLRSDNDHMSRVAQVRWDELEKMRADYAALRSAFNEAIAAHSKTHEHLAREIANHEAADKYGRKAGDERDALRAKLVALEDGEAARVRRLNDELSKKIAQIDADCVDKVSILERKLRRAEDAARDAERAEEREREALAQAAAQRERADMWQGAAQDALDQMAHWRKQAKEGTKLCDMTVGIDFRGTDTAARKLAEVAAAVAPQRDDVRRG